MGKREGLSKDEIEKIKKDAEKNRKADEKRRKAIELKNEVDKIINTTEKQIAAYTVVPEEDIKELRNAVAELKKARDDAVDDKELEKLKENVRDWTMKCGAKHYQNQGKKDDDGKKKKEGDDEENED